MYKKYEKLQFIKLYFQVYITANTLLTTQCSNIIVVERIWSF